MFFFVFCLHMGDISIRLSKTGNDDSTLTTFLPLTGLAVKGLSFFVPKISVKPKKILALLSLIFSFLPWHLSTAQENQNTQELRENIHLHLNKTKFLQGEQLWFMAYVRDQESKLPSLGTTNLHVGIYNNKGIEIKRKLFLVESGMAQGDFVIDSILRDKEYTVLAWTNYMRNFKKLPPFQQRIHILRNEMESEDSQEVNMKISIYPEGGQLIAGAYNNIGILVDNGLGQGVQVDDLELVDDSGNLIRSNIVTNRLGMGKTGFLFEAGKTYFLQRKREGMSIIRQRLPNAKTEQVGLSINNNGTEKVLFRLVSSKAIFSARHGDTYTIGVYQDDFLLLEDIEINEQEPVISLRREQLPFGTLVATLFDGDLRPIAYRMFFNHKNEESTVRYLEVDHCRTEFKDSLQVDLLVPKATKEVMVSLSALPKESLAYGADNCIFSSFFIKPYISTSYQDRYLFEEMDRRKRYELDLRLMIEGWGKYDWDSRKQGEGEVAFEMETGIPFYGKVLDADLNEENQVSMIAELSVEMAVAELDGNKSFKGNMQLFEGDSLGVSLIDKKGKLRKPKAEINFGNHANSVLAVAEWLKKEAIKKQSNEINKKSIDEPLNFEERTIVLEEVIVTERAYKIKKTDMFVTGEGIITEGRIIGDEEIKRYNSILSYLGTLGYRRSIEMDADGFFVDVLLNPKNNNPVAVDTRLLNLPLSRVQAIYFDVDKKLYVSIVLRERAYESPEQRMKFVKFAIKNGYALPQAYFTPNYSDYGSKLFKNYGALDWKANISINSDIPTTIKIPIKNQNGLQLYIEGMSSDGSLITFSEEINIEP